MHYGLPNLCLCIFSPSFQSMKIKTLVTSLNNQNLHKETQEEVSL